MLRLLRSHTRPSVLSRCKSSRVDKYERKTPHEHVLLRPGMYIGSIEPSVSDAWVFDESLHRMVKVSMNYSPALLKIFDEILVNAADNFQRGEKMTRIDVTISTDKDTGEVALSVRNDGKIIPIEKHKKEKIYIPELIFGHLLTGSNFDDTQEAFTGGRHGYGAKLTNIFSKDFEIKMYEKSTNQLYQQQWQNNMFNCGKPSISASTDGEDNNFMEVSFSPDLDKFGLDQESVDAYMSYQAARPPPVQRRNYTAIRDVTPLEGTLLMMKKRVFDVAACVGSVSQKVEVTLNGDPIPVHNFDSYVKLFHHPDFSLSSFEDGDDENNNDNSDGVFTCRVNKEWDVAVMSSPSGSFENQSFVNSVWTPRGGTHVGLVTSQIASAIEEALVKKGLSPTPHMIRSRLMVFVKGAVANPSFDSQSKDALTTSSTSFAAQCQLPANFLNKIVKQSGIVEEIVMDLESREKSKLMRATATRGTARQVNVPKLEDAHWAGTARGGECSLILTEGDSAKALAVAGLEVVGRERFGVLPLRGKILNVRGASPKAVAKNTLLMDLMKVLGLQLGKKYTGSVWPEGLERTPENEQVHCGVHGQGMRYGKVLIMTDQDHDGSHIKGLLINFFQHFWPSLTEVDGFLQQFVTPLVKVRMTGNSKKVETFYSMPEYEEWLEKTQAEQEAVGKKTKMNIKYYKGLGTNTAAEGRQYFKDLGRHRKLFFDELEGEGDPEGDDSDKYGGESVDLAFSRHRASDRKQWLEEKYDPSKYIDPYQSRISVSEFINTDLMQFSVADNKRSLPSVVDGLKPSQRKVLYGCFRKKMTPADETKVVQLAGYIAEQTAYHHGESSLHATIINMAQDYVGANNLPLLAASGQFGTRAQGGVDFASPRYIFTTLTSAARLMFPEADDYNLKHLVEDGLSVEPVYYVPVVPNILINGSYGIGTGWSTFVPPHDPLVVADHTARLIRGESVSTSPLLTTGRKGYPIPLEQLQASPDSSLLFPWVRGFAGEIHRIQDNRGITYRSYGSLERKNKTTLVISELPYGLWTDEYKDFLIQLQEAGGIKRYAEDHTHTSVRFTLTGTKDQLDLLESNSKLATVRKMRLSSVMSGRNMHAFNKDGKITRYDTPESVCEEHYAVRLQAYEDRKDYLMRKFSHEVEIHRNKSKFVQDILSGDIELLRRGGEGSGSRSESELVGELRSRGFASREVLTQMLGGTTSTTGSPTLLAETAIDGAEETVRGEDMSPESADYRYLLEMPIHSLTEERMTTLRKSAEQSEGKLNELLASSVQDLWMRDLTAFTDKVEKLPQSSGFKRRL